MPNSKSDQIQSWLDLLCQMVPGMGQAVLVPSSTEGESIVCWPEAETMHDDVMSAANLASSQNKVVTTTISASGEPDSAVDTIIALPLKRRDGLKGTLAVLVRVKPSQQSTIIQMLRWGEKWLGLLPSLQQAAPTKPQQGIAPAIIEKFSTLRSRSFALTAIVCFCILAFMNGTYRVSGTANIEGKIQRAVVAPFDGYVAAAHGRAGKSVVAGELIAELDTQELELEQQRFSAEINEYDHQYRQALSQRNNAQAHIFKSRVNQAEAQLNLLKEKINRSRLVSTLDGIIISGDLSRSLGAPVKTGDVLFEVAPLDEYRLIILVDEKQVVDINEGLKGTLTLKAMPEKKLPFEVQKVSPVFTAGQQGTAYRVEARLLDKPQGLRPGMEGVAKIDVDKRRFGWIFFHDLFDVLRIWAWRWLP